MIRPYLLAVTFLSCCAVPLSGMIPQGSPAEEDNKNLRFNEADAELLSGGLIISVGESVVLSTLIGSIQGLMYLPIKKALISAITSGVIGSLVVGIPCILPLLCFGYAFGADLDNRKYRDMNPNKPIPSLFQWKGSVSLLLHSIYWRFFIIHAE